MLTPFHHHRINSREGEIAIAFHARLLVTVCGLSRLHQWEKGLLQIINAPTPHSFTHNRLSCHETVVSFNSCSASTWWYRLSFSETGLR